jgi:hypothetical protein
MSRPGDRPLNPSALERLRAAIGTDDLARRQIAAAIGVSKVVIANAASGSLLRPGNARAIERFLGTEGVSP